MGHWGLTADQFAALWHGTGQDRLPYPVRVVSDALTAAEYETCRRVDRERFGGPAHDLLEAALLILAEPELRIEVAGRYGPDRVPIRMLGAMSRGHGVVAVQQPDVDGRSGPVVLRGCEPYDLVRQLVSQIPDVDAGGARPVAVPRRGSSPAGATRGAQDDAHVRREFEAVVNRPDFGQGVVTVVRGSRLSGRRVGGAAWRDIVGDGRYLVFGESTVTVRPGTAWDLLAGITAVVGEVPAGQAR
ncbi:ESX secretion-associated protein EspG [Rhodococcus triatomae]|uniref:EspG family protein n=1 Tax=Rhodococcus triatomae TaxID=300028 RepID=A0A1G8M2I5_9NOCA|nr:ESX secretion-associated protein EspG [Rhodococcus triatomae]QNG18221.1 ESX secretion-associated protein EspG [Rhodococcus triatomae]QNG22108.1 ESX secretion-associated protein EspG [Rhodococcus triatomae]SDI61600.1 EspG family protein [Rhodococcus triatomae]